MQLQPRLIFKFMSMYFIAKIRKRTYGLSSSLVRGVWWIKSPCWWYIWKHSIHTSYKQTLQQVYLWPAGHQEVVFGSFKAVTNSNVLERITAKFRIGRAVQNTALQTERKQQGVKSKHWKSWSCAPNRFVCGFFHRLLQPKSLCWTACWIRKTC